MADERKAPSGSAGRSRRRNRKNVHAVPGMNLRLQPEIAVKLEGEARSSGRSKTAIIEELLAARYGLAVA